MTVQPWPLQTVISGGQTGADQAGICAGRFLNYYTGGRAPKGFVTEAGPEPWLAEFNLTPSPVDSLRSRTYHNVLHSDGTVIFSPEVLQSRSTIEKKHAAARFAAGLQGGYTFDQLMASYGVTTPGSIYTAQLCIAHQKHLLVNPLEAEIFKDWIRQAEIRTLNVAGTRESRAPGIYEWVYKFLSDAMIPF